MNQGISGPKFRALHAEILDRVKSGELPSVSIGVIDGHQVRWREAIGWADVAKRLPVTSDTPYGLASLGKSLTATALMILVDRFKVDLNAPVSAYIGEQALRVYDGDVNQVTVRRVLNMTASIPHGHMIFNHPQDLDRYTIETLVKNRGIVVFPPGDVYLYSNFAYAIIEKLIEDVSGISFQNFCKTELFNPLDMVNSYIHPYKAMEIFRPAVGYSEKGTPIQALYMLPRNSLSMYASLDDLIQFAKLHLGSSEFIHPPLSQRTLEKMHDLRGEADGSLIALGLASMDLGKERCWLLTNGRAGGMQATLSMIPSEGLAVICLINSTGQAADDLAFRITDLLIPGFLNRALKIIADYETWSNRSYQVSDDLLGTWVGYIHTPVDRFPVRLRFRESGEISVNLGRGPETILMNVGYRDRLLSGECMAILPMEEAQYRPHKISFSVKPEDMQLTGFVSAEIKNHRGHFSLAGFIKLSPGHLLPDQNWDSTHHPGTIIEYSPDGMDG
jgi:CubicO group peptidase (beta-lactamase class C family)